MRSMTVIVMLLFAGCLWAAIATMSKQMEAAENHARGCAMLPARKLEGVVIQTKTYNPPIVACGQLLSKAKISVSEQDIDGERYEETYIGYFLPESTCTSGATGQPVPCGSIRRGDTVTCDYEAKEKSPGRGQLSGCVVF